MSLSSRSSIQRTPSASDTPGRRGRPPKPDAGVSHLARPRHFRSHPVHVTLRLVSGLSTLRRARMFASLHRAIAKARDRNGMRICHYSVQSNHLHLIVEARDNDGLSRGMQGLAVRLARSVNRRLQRKGTVFRDRYHARALKTAWQVRIALRYVLLNARKHSATKRRRWATQAVDVAAYASILKMPFPVGPKHCPHIDPYSSALWLEGWQDSSRGPPADKLLRDAATAPLGPADPRLRMRTPEVAPAKTHLLRHAWLKWGRLEPNEAPSNRGAV